MECLFPYLCMVTVPHIMVGLEIMLDYRGVGLARFHCNMFSIHPFSTHYILSYICTTHCTQTSTVNQFSYSMKNKVFKVLIKFDTTSICTHY